MENKALTLDEADFNQGQTSVSVQVDFDEDSFGEEQEPPVDGANLKSIEPPPAYGEDEDYTKAKEAIGEVVKEEEKPYDPWDLPELKDTGKPWSELSCCQKVWKVVQDGIIKIALLLGLLYLFICSLDFLSSAFRLLGGKAAGEAIGSSIVSTNPICGLMVGVLATVLVQSSSTTTSIVVSMVASGILDVIPAIPIVMGANIGTSVTNTIVALFQAGDRDEFRRAFAGATVHDMFNWLSVIVLLVIEIITSYLYHLTKAIVNSLDLKTNEDVDVELLKVVTKPFTSLVIQIDKKVITNIAKGDESALSKSLVKEWCIKDEVEQTFLANVTELRNVTVNGTVIPTNVTFLANVTETVTVNIERCKFLFYDLKFKHMLTDSQIGIVTLVAALVILCVCLVLIVKLLHSLLKGQIAVITKKVINSDFPGRLAWLTGYIAILVGAGLTMLVQSSSIFTSAITPLVGIGVISVERMYPFTLGANIGTTFTAILAALASSGGKLAAALQIALCHFFFNISGILIWYPVPFMRKVPVYLAKMNGNTTAKYRWFAIFYLLVMFFLLPAATFGLSLAGWPYLGSVGILFLLLLAFIVIVNVLQEKRPNSLPRKLRNWDFLPLWLHSLEPLDRILTKMVGWKFCQQCCSKCTESDNTTDDNVTHEMQGIDLHSSSSITQSEKPNPMNVV